MTDEGAENRDLASDSFDDNDTRPEMPELMLGELTAAIAADSRSALDAVPDAVAERAIVVGEAMVRASRLPVASSRTPRAPSRARSILLGGGWLAAAAMLAVLAGTPRGGANAPAALGTLALRDSLLASDSSLLQLSWLATADSNAVGATGDVTWSARAQHGVMRIAGLAVNDPARWQYQLWIFDRNRDERYPVDGGVFNIPGGEGEVFIPINPNIPVSDATLFAVTVEPAGGVVVSSRERIVLTAGL